MIVAKQLKKRRQEIEYFLLGVGILETEISFAASSLAHSFDSAGRRLNGVMAAIFLRTATLLRENDGENAFQTALTEAAPDIALTNRDLEWMARFGISLGVTDMDNELKNLRRFQQQGAAILKEAEENEKKWCRVFRGGGWLLGFGVALIFI